MTDGGRGVWERVVRLGLLGGAAGAINAALCLFRLPGPVHGDPDFGWLVVPAGALHGAALALIPLAFLKGAAGWPLWGRLALAPLVGWVGGYVSWIPLQHWVIEEGWHESAVWPWDRDGWASASWTPFAHFGLVAALYYCARVLTGSRPAALRLLASSLGAGVLGSLWWWVEAQPWHFAVIHGAVWGTLVAFGEMGFEEPAGATEK